MENGFQVAKFLFEVKKASSLFVVSKTAQWSFGLPVLALEGVLSCPGEVQGPFQRPFGPLIQLA